MPNISALPDHASISSAWLAAARYLKGQRGRHCFNLIYSVTQPGMITQPDLDLYRKYDSFAATAEIGTTTTVANTIFPLDTYKTFGSPGLYNEYEASIFPAIRTQWGTYFDRMIRRRDHLGNFMLDKTGTPINPMASMIDKLSKRVSSGRGSKNHYELAITDEGFELTTYLPERDCNYRLGGPCLSHLTFKIDDEGALRLTAIYRSHYYLERALGNLLGLARLQAFVAAEVGLNVGPLTCLAAHAYLEPSLPTAPGSNVGKFLDDCGV
ncbi:MAG: hypothetical protein EON58_20100 [Alphaproteobacteria bacterium]|nr:MAG: hypothetical protein EON58_20100 [Alphaproteobacteria bacterium]